MQADHLLDLWAIKKLKIMTTNSSSNTAISSQTAETARSLRNLYFTRTTFSVIWIILVTLFAKTSAEIVSILLIIYPAWDVVGTFLDIRANQHSSSSKTPQ